MDVEVRQIDNFKGKGLFAKKDFKKGSTILEEDPLLCCQFSWNAYCKYKACDHCLRPLETTEENARRLTGKPDLVLPYPDCCTTDKSTVTSCELCGVEYCCFECKQVAFERYHKSLCVQTKDGDSCHPVIQLNEAWKQIHYPPESSTVILIARMLAYIHQSSDRETAQAQIMQFCHRTVNKDQELAHKLVGENYTDQITLLHQLLVEAVPHEGVEQFLSLEAFYSLLGLIGTNGQGVGTSAISQWVAKCTELELPEQEKEKLDGFIDRLYEDIDVQSGSFINNEGVALYLLQSTCNHNCLPNAEPTYLHNNSRLCLIAVRDIQAGEEICISYLDECDRGRSRHSRQKLLKENYLFVCNCEKCLAESEQPDCTSEEEEGEEEMSE